MIEWLVLSYEMAQNETTAAPPTCPCPFYSSTIHLWNSGLKQCVFVCIVCVVLLNCFKIWV